MSLCDFLAFSLSSHGQLDCVMFHFRHTLIVLHKWLTVDHLALSHLVLPPLSSDLGQLAVDHGDTATKVLAPALATVMALLGMVNPLGTWAPWPESSLPASARSQHLR